jgi:hypothetical protein
MLSTTCHCGAVRITIPRAPETLTNCNCSICRRYGVLWAYYRSDEVTLDAAPGAMQDYIWGDRMIAFLRCATCGCVVAYVPTPEHDDGRTAVNARNFEPLMLGDVTIRKVDGADTGKVVE